MMLFGAACLIVAHGLTNQLLICRQPWLMTYFTYACDGAAELEVGIPHGECFLALGCEL